MTSPLPALDEFFEDFSLLAFLRRRHPYDFRLTYELTRALLGYEAFYVNFGLWTDEMATREAGRELAYLVGREAELAAGGRLIDAGSGLGQAAVDLCLRFDLARVTGLDVNRRQVAFANALAGAHGLANRVRHHLDDANDHVASVSAKTVDHVIAIEAMNHFRDPDRFLRAVRAALVPGGRIAFCVNTAPRASLEARIWMKLAWGVAPPPGELWVKRLSAAGFEDIRRTELTDAVVVPSARRILSRVAETPNVSPLLRFAIIRANRDTLCAIERGEKGYELFSGRRSDGA